MLGTDSFTLTELCISIIRDKQYWGEGDIEEDIDPVKREQGLYRLSVLINTANILIYIMVVDLISVISAINI